MGADAGSFICSASGSALGSPGARLTSFRLGVNYLPPEAGMAWMRPYDAARTRRHFARAATAGFDSIRVFLPWEAAQPDPGQVDAGALNDLVDVADAAGEARVELIVTLFTGHMSAPGRRHVRSPGTPLSGPGISATRTPTARCPRPARPGRRGSTA